MITLIQHLRHDSNALFERAGFPGCPPFLRRADDDDFLLCSDAPRRLIDPLHAALLFKKAGLTLMERDGLWFLDARACDYGQLDASLTMDMPSMPTAEKYLGLWALVRMLHEHPSPVSCQPKWAVRRTVKTIEAGEKAILSLANSLPPHLAELLRRKEPLPYLSGKLLAHWLNGHIRKDVV